MTKERKIAIAMWEYIRDNYEAYVDNCDYCENGEDALCALKKQYLDARGIHWAYHCWFCEYIGHRGRGFNIYRCKFCPLQDCSTGPYRTLIRMPTQSQYIDACDEIIVALGGEV